MLPGAVFLLAEGFRLVSLRKEANTHTHAERVGISCRVASKIVGPKYWGYRGYSAILIERCA